MAKKKKKAAKKVTKKAVKDGIHLVISPPNMQVGEFEIGNAGLSSPYVQNKFSTRDKMVVVAKQKLGESAKKPKRKPKDFGAIYEGSMHKSVEGWRGIPATALRNALIDSCRISGYAMTKAKLSVFILADGNDPDDNTPLIKITGKPHRVDSTVRLATGVMDIKPRAHWASWKAKVRIMFDADQFRVEDIANLLARAGLQVGIGAGRHNSKDSFGMGWGCFKILK